MLDYRGFDRAGGRFANDSLLKLLDFLLLLLLLLMMMMMMLLVVGVMLLLLARLRFGRREGRVHRRRGGSCGLN